MTLLIISFLFCLGMGWFCGRKKTTARTYPKAVKYEKWHDYWLLISALILILIGSGL